MKQALLILSFFFLALQVHGQIWNVNPDSTIFIFDGSDSLTRYKGGAFLDTAHTDTTNTYLWQIGNTSKAFFANGGLSTGIMTDTLDTYPVGANSWFTLKLNDVSVNFLVLYFDHKYDTHGNDGGMVEYSIDSGATWENVKGPCKDDIKFENFYEASDLLPTGEPAFRGNSMGWRTSGLQLPGIMGVRRTGDCYFASHLYQQYIIWIRFRFKSDSIADNKAGWIISNIKLKPGFYRGSVAEIESRGLLNIYPNPSHNGLFKFPALKDERDYTICITNILGQVILQQPYVHTLDMSIHPNGMYFYQVTNGETQYSGKLVVQ